MKSMKIWRTAFAILVAMLSLASCSSDPEWADPEAHEKAELLQKQYGPLIAGTWHIEKIGERQRYFERLTFNADGTLKGMRKWQSRKLVSIDGKEQYTDWEDLEDDTFTGTWTLSWNREPESSFGGNRLVLWASFDGEYDKTTYMAYNLNARFITANETTLCIGGGNIQNGEDGETIYTRGDAEPGF